MMMKHNLHGAGLGYKRAFADDFLAISPETSPIQFIEIAPENWIKMGGGARKKFDAVAEKFPIACHGLSLSLGSYDDLNVDFVKQIKALMRQYNMQFFSEHLSYCSANGQVYDLLPLPFTADAVKNTASRIRMVQDILEQTIALENTSYYVHNEISEMSEVAFLNAVAQEADCAIHLDVNNIYVNWRNHGLVTAEEYLRDLDWHRVAYMHMAGHDAEDDLLIDTHGQAVCDEVWDLFEQVCARLPHPVPCLLERDNNFPPFRELLTEVQRISNILQKHHHHEQVA